MKLTDKQKKGLAAIIDLDLSDVSARVVKSDDQRRPGFFRSGPPAAMARAQRDYRRYLALRLLYPERTIMPTGWSSRMVDALWHEHILDTRRYAADCQAVYGAYLHHVPGIPADPSVAALYRETFTASVWGTPDPAIVPLLYKEDDAADPMPGDDSDGEDCA